MNKTDSPWVRTVRLAKPTLQDNTADTDRLISALKAGLQTDAVHLDLELLKKLPDLLRKWEYHVRCILFKDRRRWLVTAIAGVDDPRPFAGLAVDLGTTKVVLRLLDLSHLFMGLDPRWIIREPYIPAVNKPGILKAAELGIQVNAGARVFIFPNVGSYFGSDHQPGGP